MRYLVISDMHANLEALEATLADAGPTDAALVLGDLVGYGADPNAVVDRVRALETAAIIRGNHDKVAAGIAGTDGFNHLARHAIEWTASALTPANRDWLAALPQGPVSVDAVVEICHGAPFDEDLYIFDDLDAARAIEAVSRPVCLFGHTHVPVSVTLEADQAVMRPVRGASVEIRIEAGRPRLVNCGAVGQPRDGDPRAAYGVLDTDAMTVTVRRVEYDLQTAQSKILAAGLPEVLARRLGVGR